jgi:GalNAc-alpha-(1->4)-GalNAc-alpha-(1->3)-diNAcBac-PP-undecaprenol alpha-1,4-N-acetyl-D-galactosaminyltransferase
MIPSLHVGGMERVMTELCNYFVRQRDLEVHLILYGLNRSIFYELSDQVKVYRPDFEFLKGKRVWSTLRTMLFLRRKIKELRPDCIVSFGEYWNNFVLMSLIGYTCPIVVSDRCGPDKKLVTFHNSLRKLLYPRAATVVVQTKMAHMIYQKFLPNANIVSIGNPVRSISFDPWHKREKIVLSVGRLIKTKHHDLLIRIFKSLDKPDWKLLIIGDDAQNQNHRLRLQRLIKDLKAENSISLIGTQRDVEKYYRIASIFAFTSSSEGFPNAVAEALTAGVPVVAFNCIAGPSDLIDDGENGFLIPTFDNRTFSEKLRLLMEDENLRSRMQAKAIESVSDFTSDKICEKFYSLLSSLADKNESHPD